MFLLLVSAAGVYASGKSDTYADLIRNGTAGDIKAALKKDGDIITYSVGGNDDTLLMSAVEYNRSRDVIKLLLDAGIGPTKKNKLGQSAVTYICRYCGDAGTASMVLSYGTFSKSQIRTRLMSKDKSGKYAAQYTDENSSAEIQQLVKSYLRENDIALLFPTESGGSSADDNQSAESSSPPVQTEVSPAASAPVSASSTPAAIVPPPAAVSASEEAAAVPSSGDAAGKTEQNAQAAPQTQTADTSAEVPPDSDAAVRLPPSDTEPVLPPKASAYQKTSGYQKTSLYDYASVDDAGSSTPAVSSDNEFIPDANTADAHGVTPLMTALKDGNDWEVNALLYSGADVNAADKEGWTPLMYAVRYQNSEKLVSTLIGHGAGIRVQNKYNTTPLTIAAQYSENPSILSQLLAAYSAGENEVFKALIYAITGNASSDRIRLAKVQLFVDKGTPLNRFWEGKTPLMYAAETGSSTPLIALLVKNGAIISTRTSDRKTAFDFAQVNTTLPHDQIYWSLNTGR